MMSNFGTRHRRNVSILLSLRRNRERCHRGSQQNTSNYCNLKVYRVAQGLTQEQLAEKVGVRRETIMRLEKAQYNPSLKLAIDISRVLNAPIEDIFIFK